MRRYNARTIDLKREQLLTLAEAAATLPGVNGKPMGHSTIRR
jgi:uncharacterized protein YbjT (DUF2867 family)